MEFLFCFLVILRGQFAQKSPLNSAIYNYEFMKTHFWRYVAAGTEKPFRLESTAKLESTSDVWSYTKQRHFPVFVFCSDSIRNIQLVSISDKLTALSFFTATGIEWRMRQIYICSCSSNPDYMAAALTWQIEMALSRDPRPAPTAHQCCLRLQCQHSGLCAAQWGQLFPLTPRAHVTKAHREWERDRHPDICLCRLRDMQTHKHCRDTGTLHNLKPTRRDARVWLAVHDFTHNCKIVTLLMLRALGVILQR